MQTRLPLQTFLQPYFLKAHHFRLGLNYLPTITAIPKGNIFLFFIWGEGSWEHRQLHYPETTKKEGLYVLGQQFEITIISTKYEELNIIGFELNPVAFHQLFSTSAKFIVNKLICLQEIFPIDCSEIFRQVTREETILKKLSDVENFLWARIQVRKANKPDVLFQAISIIERYHGNIPIKKLAENLKICTRSLERRFYEIAGVSPKTYSKIIQFNYAFRLFVQTNKTIVDIALEAGYYDQSHFINHFRKVCGRCPTQFFAEHKLLGDDGIPNKWQNETAIISGPFRFRDNIFFH